MKSYLPIVLLASLALTAGAAAADERGGPGFGGRHGDMSQFRDPARMVERMSRVLDLDELQEQNINNIVSAATPEIDALRDRRKSTREAMRALDPADPDYSAKLSTLATDIGELATESTLLLGRVRLEVSEQLTDAQKAELKEAFEQRRGRFMRRFRDRRGGADSDSN